MFIYKYKTIIVVFILRYVYPFTFNPRPGTVKSCFFHFTRLPKIQQTLGIGEQQWLRQKKYEPASNKEDRLCFFYPLILNPPPPNHPSVSNKTLRNTSWVQCTLEEPPTSFFFLEKFFCQWKRQNLVATLLSTKTLAVNP